MYILAFILTMITPVAMFFMGLIWSKRMPTKSQLLSYRSELSMKNEETWAFAHDHIAKLWIRVGVITAILTIILMRVFADYYTSFLLWLLFGQMVFFCGSIFFVDSLMKAVFDEEGNRII